tara:strand:- start:693 stop:1145 length:453 start_codon:yes stop_codon:yes gene_type:complete
MTTITNKLNILLLFIENDKINETIQIKEKIENNFLSNSRVIDIINNNVNEEGKTDYKLEYILKFMIKIDMEELSNTNTNTNTNTNNTCLLETIKNLNKKEIIDYKNQDFNAVDSLILIFNKKEKKAYIQISKQKNKTKKQRNKETKDNKK